MKIQSQGELKLRSLQELNRHGCALNEISKKQEDTTITCFAKKMSIANCYRIIRVHESDPL